MKPDAAPKVPRFKKAKCSGCRGTGTGNGDGATYTACSKCDGAGYHEMRRCSKCGRDLRVLYNAGLITHAPQPILRSVCPGTGTLGLPIPIEPKPEPRSVRWRLDQKVKRRMESAIKKHDKHALLELSNPPLIPPSTEFIREVSYSISDLITRPRRSK